MYSFVLMAALTAGGNAPDCYWYGYYPAYYYSYPVYYGWSGWYYPAYYSGWYYPYYSWGWYGWPGYCGCGPVVCVAPSDAENGGAADRKGAGAGADQKKKAGKKVPLQEGFGPEKKKTSSLGNKALLVVNLPADAKLFIDDNPTKSVSSNRNIVTPPLQPGQTYFYRVRAELSRDGRTFTETQEVLLRPGEQSRASFTDLEARAAVFTKTAAR
jgi:uncharacterized protein (TIGR03000 family)